MTKHVVGVCVLLSCAAGMSAAAAQIGIVTEITSDTITVQNEVRTITCRFSVELLTNTPDGLYPGAPIIEVKKGDKVRIECRGQANDPICTNIHIFQPASNKEDAKSKDK
jgi:hypothetical protein